MVLCELFETRFIELVLKVCLFNKFLCIRFFSFFLDGCRALPNDTIISSINQRWPKFQFNERSVFGSQEHSSAHVEKYVWFGVSIIIEIDSSGYPRNCIRREKIRKKAKTRADEKQKAQHSLDLITSTNSEDEERGNWCDITSPLFSFPFRIYNDSNLTWFSSETHLFRCVRPSFHFLFLFLRCVAFGFKSLPFRFFTLWVLSCVLQQSLCV